MRKTDCENVFPFVRWAGGKRWFLKHITDLLPAQINNYHEPFLGGGSVFWHIKNTYEIKGEFFLSDTNEALINSYLQLKSKPEEIIDILKTYHNVKEFYYQLRSKKFTAEVEQAAQFIYLNKTSYNGIYRVNKEGQYNVPYGRRKSQNLFDINNIRKCSTLLDDSVNLCSADFEIVKTNIKKGDLVFLDPPYTVAHENNGFIQYNQTIFSWEDQKRLASLLKFISSSGAHFILTNAAHFSISDLFESLGEKRILQRHSTIGGKGANRNSVNEYVFTNIKRT